MLKKLCHINMPTLSVSNKKPKNCFRVFGIFSPFLSFYYIKNKALLQLYLTDMYLYEIRRR